MDEKTRASFQKFIEKYQIGNGAIRYNGREIKYSILSADAETNLPGFVGYPDGEFLFVSVEVPSCFKPYFLLHEILELTDPAIMNREDRCLAALRIELAMVPDELYRGYVAYRSEFFDRLVEYYSKQEVDNAFLVRITQSRDYLRDLIAKV